MRGRILMSALMVAVGLSTAAFGQGAPRVVVGDNPSLSGAPLYVALEKGYYREAGIDVQLEMSGTSSDMDGSNNFETKAHAPPSQCRTKDNRQSASIRPSHDPHYLRRRSAECEFRVDTTQSERCLRALGFA
jgi:hypothetical protein